MELTEIVGQIGIHCIIINQKGEFLVLKRHIADKYDPNCWDLPGGSVDENENLLSAIKREIAEETNLTVKKINPIGAYTCEYGRLQLCAVSKLTGGELKLSPEHCDCQWLTLEEFISLKPAGLHLLAAQFFLQREKKVTTFEELVK